MKKPLLFSFVFITLISLGLGYSEMTTTIKTKDLTDCQNIMEFQGKRIQGLNGKQIIINKEFLGDMKDLDMISQKNNVDLIIISSLRAENQFLSNQVHKAVKNSNHLTGFAIDFNLIHKGEWYNSNQLSNINEQPRAIRQFIQSIRNHPRLRWGGDFIDKDPIHIDFPLNKKSQFKWSIEKVQCQKELLSAPIKKIKSEVIF
jgi:hypothetical protein